MSSDFHVLVYPLESAPRLQSFEDFAERISDWPGMFFEMDGSFVWSIRNANDHPHADAQDRVGQIDGMVYDRENRIEYLDLKGSAAVESWLQLLNSLVSCSGTEPTPLPPTLLPPTPSSLEPYFKIYDVQKGDFTSLAKCFAASSID